MMVIDGIMRAIVMIGVTYVPTYSVFIFRSTLQQSKVNWRFSLPGDS
jgi:hypothetical protein